LNIHFLPDQGKVVCFPAVFEDKQITTMQRQG